MGLEVDHRLHGDLAGGSAPVADLAGSDLGVASLQPRGARRTLQGGVGEVDIEDDLPTFGLDGLDRRGVQVEGHLRARHFADGHRAADVEGLRRTEVLELGSEAGDRGLEVLGVGQVQLAVHACGAVVGVLLLLDGEVAAVGLHEASFLGEVGHELGDGLLDQSMQLIGTDLVRRRSDVGVHERRRLPGQQKRPVGDPTGLPGAEVAPDHAPPHAGKAVAELEGLPDVRLARVGGQAEGGGELGDRELRHQRRTRTGQRHPLVAVPDQHLRLVDRVGRVHRRPRHRVLQQPRLGRVHDRPILPRSSQHRRSGVELDRACCHRRIQAPTTDTQTPKTPCSTGMWTTISRNLSTATTAVDPSRPQEGKQAEVVRRPQRRATT